MKTKSKTPAMSPYFHCCDYRPTMAGPYECKMAELIDDEAAPTHMRWYNGDRWSLPLQPEHEDLDGGFMPPSPLYFPNPETMSVLMTGFVWRGFNEDQEPL